MHMPQDSFSHDEAHFMSDEKNEFSIFVLVKINLLTKSHQFLEIPKTCIQIRYPDFQSCSFCLPRVPFVNCRQFMYLVISLLVLRAGYGI